MPGLLPVPNFPAILSRNAAALPGSHSPRETRVARTAHTCVRAVALATLVVMAACKKDMSAPGPQFSIAPDTASLVVGQAVQLTAVNAPGPVAWTSNNTLIAAVIAQTGFVQAVGRGDATITAQAGTASATARIHVSVPPGIALSKPTIDFEVTQGDPDPAAQTVNVSNSGDGTLTGLAVGTIAYGASQPTGWLTATISAGTAPATLTLSAKTQGLGRGTFTAIVPITAPGIDNSPQNVAVTFSILAPASITLTRTSVPLAGIPNTTIKDSVGISNGGDRPLTGLATTITYTGGPAQNWLQAALSATTAPATLNFTANTAGLTNATYTANVRVSSSVTGVAPRDIAVQLVVGPGPAIALSRTAVGVAASNGVNPGSQTVNVTNSGGGTLTNLGFGTITYGAGQPGNWLAATLNTATAPAVITLNLTTAPLASGSYTATVPVTSSVASNSPINIVVTLTVGPPPAIFLNPTIVFFSGWRGGNPQAQQGVQITNSGTGTLNGLSFSIAYGPTASGWLSGSFQGGVTAAPTTLLLVPNTTNIVEGTHTATVTISSNIAGVASRTVDVTYQVRSFTLNVYPIFFAPNVPNCSSCHSGAQQPNLSQSAMQLYNNLLSGGYVTPNSTTPVSPNLVCKAISGCAHVGGKMTGLNASTVLAWILAGAPFQ